MKKVEPLVTREKLHSLVNDPDSVFVDDVIGRALWGLFLRQTESEQSASAALETNGRGFSEADSRSGSITAKYYKKHGHLGRCSCKANGNRHKKGVDYKVDDSESWRTKRWTKPASNKFATICKYAVQLNEIAVEKVQAARVAAPVNETPPWGDDVAVDNLVNQLDNGDLV